MALDASFTNPLSFKRYLSTLVGVDQRLELRAKKIKRYLFALRYECVCLKLVVQNANFVEMESGATDDLIWGSEPAKYL